MSAEKENLVPQKGQAVAIELPPNPGYGAAELKIWISKYTLRAYIITAATILLIVFLYLGRVKYGGEAQQEVLVAPIVKIDITDLPPPSMNEAELLEPPPTTEIIHSGPAARAGTPIAVPDAQITPEMQQFAQLDVLDKASSVGGTGEGIDNWGDNIDWDGSRNKVAIKQEEEPAIDDFIPVEKEPEVDLAKLQKLVAYPDIARRAGIEGRVGLRILVGADGNVRRKAIEYSDNEMLNQAALDAVDKYGRFVPAIQNGEPIMVWVSIPIVFRLR
jgi:TonB family protein